MFHLSWLEPPNIVHIDIWDGRGEDRGDPLSLYVLREPFPGSKAVWIMLLHGRAFRGSPWRGFWACPGIGAPTLVMSKIRVLGFSGVTAGEAVGRKNPLGLVEDSSSG